VTDMSHERVNAEVEQAMDCNTHAVCTSCTA